MSLGTGEGSGWKTIYDPWDVIVIGTGAAALTSALSAAKSSIVPLRILIIDSAPAECVGGNGYFTAGAYRVAHQGLQDLLPLVSNVTPEQKDKIDLPAYTPQDFRNDFDRLCEGKSDRVLTQRVIDESLQTVQWLKANGGVDWWLSFRRQSYEVDGKIVFWGGLHLTVKDGGKGLIANLLTAVREAGCVFAFGLSARNIQLAEDNSVRGVRCWYKSHAGVGYENLRTSSVIMCAGGFEANPELRQKYLGAGWERAHTRGSWYNDGHMIESAAELGAQLKGDFSFQGCHSVSWDADSPKREGDRVKTNEFTKNGYPLGLMLNAEGQRFVDEGSDLRNYTYAKNGRAVLQQPDGIAWQVWDSDALQWLKYEEYRDEVCRKTWADTLDDLALKLAKEGLKDTLTFVRTIEKYNAAVLAHRNEHPDMKFNPAIKDGLSTQSSGGGLELPKSNWALPIVKAPFIAVKITTGITFTFGGLAIDPESATVLRKDDTEIPGLYCAGEMVGGLFYSNYPGGSGLTAGAVFGRRAGRSAAGRALALRALKCHQSHSHTADDE